MTQLAASGRATAGDGGAGRIVPYFWLVAAALLALRLMLDSLCNLVPDEAFYWTWTRHLSAGYFDHPPMVAWVIWLSTRVLGNTELGVRMGGSVVSIGSLAVVYWLARRLLHDARAVGFVILMWISGPLLPVIGTIVTPDAPATFFSVCGLACAVVIAGRDDLDERAGYADGANSAGPWLLFGVFCGLAFLSKYTTVLLPAGVGLAMVSSRRGRRHFARPWIYLSAILALALFSPCIYWNYKHQWASFLFQIHHGTGSGNAESEGVHGFGPMLASVAGYIGGQAAVWTPVLFAMAVYVMLVNWGKEYARFRNRTANRLSGVERLLLISGTLPLIVFGLASTRTHSEINWPAFAYFPLSLLVGRYLSANWQGNRVQWARAGCQVALGFTIGVHLITVPAVQRMLIRCGVPVTHQLTDLWGWNEFGTKLGQRANGMPVVCNRHQDAGEAAFYMPGQPDVWCDGIGFRTTAFDYFDDGPDLKHVPAVLFVGAHGGMFKKKWDFAGETDLPEIDMHHLGKKRSREVTIFDRSNVNAMLKASSSALGTVPWASSFAEHD